MKNKSKKKTNRGRKDKLQPQLVERFFKAIKAGSPPTQAAAYAGICWKTYYNWKQRGEAIESQIEKESRQAEIDKLEKDKYFQFLQDLKKAESECILRNLIVINEASATNWQASAWILERRWPEHFGK